MFKPVRVVDIELSSPLETIAGSGGYGALQGLVRLYGTPIGYVRVPVTDGRCPATILRDTIFAEHTAKIVRHLLHTRLATPVPPKGLQIGDLFHTATAPDDRQLPLVTVAVCTRDRTANLAICLDALNRLTYPLLDILVVDNAPSSDATERLIRTSARNMRYVCEPRPGLNWARNRAIIEARGEIIAYTDDDVLVDPGWVSALARVLVEDPQVMAVTGLVVPYELETKPQLLFERYGGFGRGFERQWYRLDRARTFHIGAGRFGTGANMAYRRTLFDLIGFFDPALDVGTVTNGGGDLEMFFRVLQEGYTLVYEPSALVRHRHRSDYAQLRTQMTNNGIGLYSYFVRSALAYPEQRSAIIRFGLWWKWWWHIRRLLISFIYPSDFPRDLIWAELRGAFIGLARYQRARRIVTDIAHVFGLGRHIALPQSSGRPRAPVQGDGLSRWRSLVMPRFRRRTTPIAVRTVDLSETLHGLTDVLDYRAVRVYVTLGPHLLGSVDIANHGQPVSNTRLRQAIVDTLALKLLQPILAQHYLPTEAETTIPTRLPADVSASIVVATRNRPDYLRDSLRGLRAQVSSRPIEIIVVDNDPPSGLTPPVVAEFPGVVLVNEQRKGSAYARNEGVITSSGDVVITTDDDVTMPPDWLEKLLAPFVRPDVMIVTGNVLPFELETMAQQLFEAYGGLGRGLKPWSANGDWFTQFRTAVPTWQLGGTANAAFRATIFSHPAIGLLDEALGAGASGVGEDTYLFYKVLREGYTVVYEPAAYVWHKHRRDLTALRRQIYSYSKGHVAYLLTTVTRDRDWRALIRLGIRLPQTHICRIKERVRGRSDYPVWLILLEIAGNLAGPYALWRARRRVKREGRSGRYIPVWQRAVVRDGPLQG